jgi:FAD/FMN-containing dehydrogenase
LVGSRGTLAVLTAVHLRLRALPERDVTLALLADSASPLVEVAAGMRELAVEPAAAELLSPAAAAAVMGEPSWVLVLRLHGSAEVVADEESRLDGLAGAAVRRLQLPALPATSLWTGLGKLESNSTAVFRLADRPASLGMTRERAARLAQSAEAAGGVLLAHALDGIVRVLLRPAADAGQLRAIAETAAALRAEIAASGGSLILAKGPADLYGLLDPFGPAGPTLRLMQGLKSTFDPRGVLAPGRFL